MKRIIFLLLGVGYLCACAGWQRQEPCATALRQPSFFAQGEKLAAFEVRASAKGTVLDGILQIKKTAISSYEVTLYSASAGYRWLQASVTPQRVTYTFMAAPANRAVVRRLGTRLLRSLLFTGQGPLYCHRQDSSSLLRYKKPVSVQYVYPDGSVYPTLLIYPKTWGKAYLHFLHYGDAENVSVPDLLQYQDGPVTIDLKLLRLRP